MEFSSRINAKVVVGNRLEESWIFSSVPVGSPPFACGWCPQGVPLLATVDEKGFLYLKKCNKINNTESKMPVHRNAVLDLCWMSTDVIITASADRTVALWDVQQRTNISVLRAHETSVKSVCLMPDDASASVICSAGRDSQICIWDIRDSVSPLTKSKRFDGLTCATLLPGRFLSAGNSSGSIALWDFRNFRKVNRYIAGGEEKKLTNNRGRRAVVYLQPTKDGIGLLALCCDDTLRRYWPMWPNKQPDEWNCPKGSFRSFDLRFDQSPCGRFIVSGSVKDNAYIWRSAQPGLPFCSLLNDHSDTKLFANEVCSVSWCSSDCSLIAGACDTNIVKIWSIGGCKETDTNTSTRFTKQNEAQELNVAANENSCMVSVRNVRRTTGLSIEHDGGPLSNKQLETKNFKSPCVDLPNRVLQKRKQVADDTKDIINFGNRPAKVNKGSILNYFSRI